MIKENPIYDTVLKYLMEDERIDKSAFTDDKNMQLILHRLTMAVDDLDLRYTMNVENEIYSLIERRDTELLSVKEKLKEIESQIKEQESQLKEQESQINGKKSQLKEQGEMITDMLRKTISMLIDLGFSVQQIAEKTGKTAEEVEQLSRLTT